MRGNLSVRCGTVSSGRTSNMSTGLSAAMSGTGTLIKASIWAICARMRRGSKFEEGDLDLEGIANAWLPEGGRA